MKQPKRIAWVPVTNELHRIIKAGAARAVLPIPQYAAILLKAGAEKLGLISPEAGHDA